MRAAWREKIGGCSRCNLVKLDAECPAAIPCGDEAGCGKSSVRPSRFRLSACWVRRRRRLRRGQRQTRSRAKSTRLQASAMAEAAERYPSSEYLTWAA